MISVTRVERDKMMEKPSSKELKVLNLFAGDAIVTANSLSKVGLKTLRNMMSNGWIERVDGYRITGRGKRVLNPGLCD